MAAKLRGYFSAIPFDRKLAVAMIASSLLIGILTISLCTLLAINAAQSSRQQKYGVVAGLLGQLLARTDKNEMTALLRGLSLDKDLDRVCVYSSDPAAALTFEHQFKVTKINCSPTQPNGAALTEGDFSYSTLSKNVPLHVVLHTSNLCLSRYLQSSWWVLGLIVVASILLAFLFSSWVGKQLLIPIYGLLEVIGSVRRNQDYCSRAEKFADDEFGALCDNFNDMIADIERRDREVLSARRELELRVCEVDVSNRELSGTLQRLKQTQQQLINNEKMASLGALVAGVAHEINTPVGVGVTAASTLKSNTDAVQKRYQNGELTQSALQLYWEQTAAASQMILGNLERAAGLIQSFKLVAVDQSNSEVRRFNIKEYMAEVLRSVNPQIRKAGLEYCLECEEDLVICSYPGALSQIVTNLVMNAIYHAYPNGESGCLSLNIQGLPSGEIKLQFTDDGRGIPAENLSRVCDPFFTTRRGRGGSGLGLHIVYNLVTQQLCGKIKIDSEEGKGTSITLLFPPDVAKVGFYESV
ncbi:MAG: HAMP domain-containing sensor histidine kinase [Zhongshania sp.]|uniref:sensor histidine kinase n=1 Tax=Zhongshania sp. TaxID=1971902 RepID=UPI00262F48B6|nr:HAMP domain-containing sensor histidine kinase [Zhongshania sp.]MDF1693969.1 HAMP domain-containing sensor histidine kinase [Zhongshania sp.]